MRYLAVFGVVCFLALSFMMLYALMASPDSGLGWIKTYGSTGSEMALSVTQTSDGGYALAGVTISYGVGGDFWLVKTDASGNLEWSENYGGENLDMAYSVIQTSDGGYAIAGLTESYGAGEYDCWLVKTDASGNLEWSGTYGGTSWDGAHSVIQTSDGGYILAGYTYSLGAGSADFWLVKVDSSGNEEWSKTYGSENLDKAHSAVQTSDGGYALAGFTYSFDAGGYDFWLVKTDSLGNEEWNKTFGGENREEASSVIQTSDGGYALAGYTTSYGVGGRDFWLVKTDSSGNLEWSENYGGENWEWAYSVIQTSDGGYALTGYTQSYGAGGLDFWIVMTDSSGNMTWGENYGGENSEIAYSIIQTSDGSYALAGFTGSYGVGGNDFMLVKLPSQKVEGVGYMMVAVVVILIVVLMLIFYKWS
jgi:hypothetical protein